MTSSTTPDEKSIEVTFAIYAHRLADEMRKKLITFAPSQQDEEELAYDSRLIGSGCRELYIQFKKSYTHNYGLSFPIRKKKQLENLQDKYPPFSAFYVAASFPNSSQLLDAQHRLDNRDFLDSYFAVDARSLDDNSNSVRYINHILSAKTNISSYPNHGPERVECPINRPQWLTGYELLCTFLDYPHCGLSSRRASLPAVGSRIIVRNGQAYRVEPNYSYDDPELFLINRAKEPIYIPGNEVHLLLRVFD